MGWKRIEREVLRLTNAERSRCGLARVDYSRRLHRAAKTQAKHMMRIKWITHTGPHGNQPADRAKREGYCEFVGECCTGVLRRRGQSDREIARRIFRSWMSSTPHDERGIRAAHWRTAGVAVVRRLPRGSTYYVSLVFGVGVPNSGTTNGARRKRKSRRARRKQGFFRRLFGWMKQEGHLNR